MFAQQVMGQKVDIFRDRRKAVDVFHFNEIPYHKDQLVGEIREFRHSVFDRHEI